MKSTRIVALVPMRDQSERIPGKNYRLFAGQPLYYHIVKRLMACPMIAEVVVDTDSDIIRAGVEKDFPEVHLIERPEHLRAGTVPMNDVLLHDTEQVEADYYVQTHSTNPLLRTGTISGAIQHFLDRCGEYDSLFSVTRLQVRLWDNLVKPVNHDPSVLLRTQDLPPVFEENSCLYIFPRDTLERFRNRIGERPLMYEIDRPEAWDIDEEMDFHIAEFLYKKYFLNKE